MQVKPKICKGTNKAIGHGCGELKYIHRFGLCSKCFGTWLYSTDSGNELLEKSTIKGKKIVDQKEKIKIKELKEKNITPDKYRSKTLQPNINKIARLIDFGNPCIATGNYGKMNGGHRISVGSNRTTALNLHNIFIQSYQSNKFKGGDNIKYDIGIEETFGIKYLDYIKGLHKHKKLGLTVSDLKCINLNAIAIIKELESNPYVRTPYERIELRNEINLKLGIYQPEFCVFNL